MTMPKFHIIRDFGTASISLVGFAHTRSFQDGDQKQSNLTILQSIYGRSNSFKALT